MTSVGIDAFGFNDSVDGRQAGEVFDRPACVVLGEARGGRTEILTGLAADQSRIQQGFHWPPESRLPAGTEPVRRIPVSLLWEALASGRGRGARFGMFEPEDLLCAHVDSVCPPEEGVRRVLAIPNTLGMAAQERLLRAFGSHRKDITLLWRPVAAVLGWLEHLPRNAFSRPGWVGVCCLGADGFEFTKMELDLSHPAYVIPVRSRPGRKNEPRADGFDLAQSCALNFYPKLQSGNPTRLWQGLLRFPHVWDHIRTLPPRPAPALWSCAGAWDIDLGKPYASAAIGYGRLPSTGARCVERRPFACAGDEKSASVNESTSDGRSRAWSTSWNDRLAGLAATAFGHPEDSACLGIIVCGALSPSLSRPPAWIRNLVQSYGLQEISNGPALRCVSLLCEDLVSQGARIYGERLDFNTTAAPEDRKPTYFDTLPNIRLCVQKEDQLVWPKLFEDDRCEGGRSAENTLEIFSLKKKSAFVDIWLRMSDENAEDDEADPDDLEKTPIRYSRVYFERKPDQDVPLRLKASMTPSSGFASVFFTPADPAFDFILPGGAVRLNFETMEPKLEKDLPQVKLSYPRDGRRELALKKDFNHKVQDLLLYASENEDPPKISKALQKSRRNPHVSAGRIYAVNEKGEQKTFNPELFDNVRRLIDEKIQTSENWAKWINPASWLWGACPEKAKAEIFRLLKEKQRKLTRIGYAVRVAQTDREIEAVLSEAVQYITETKKYQILPNAAKFLTWLLSYRPGASRVLAARADWRDEFVKALEVSLGPDALDELKPSAFQWLPALFSVLLKVRKWDHGFLKSPEDIARWKDSLQALSLALTMKIDSNPGSYLKYKPSLSYYEEIGRWLEGAGNDVPVLSDDLKDDNSDDDEDE